MKKTDQIVLLDILKLSKENYSSRQIAELTGCSKTTACHVLQKAKDLGIDFDKAVEIGTNKLFQAIYPPRELRPLDEAIYAKFLDFNTDKRLTRMVLWEEYIKENPDGLKYGQFCNIFKKFDVPAKELVYIKEKRPGGVMEVDWVGDKLPWVYCVKEHKKKKAHIFVAVLGESGMPYAEAFEDETTASWLRANENAMRFYQGVPRSIVPDNCKTAVTKPDRVDPTMAAAFTELSRHYKVAIIPTRVKKPKDKGAVEGAVGTVEVRMYAALRNREFPSFEALNEALREVMEDIASRPYQKKDSSRKGVFLDVDQPALRPLPPNMLDRGFWVERKVQPNYHVSYKHENYSVPYSMFGKEVALKLTDTTVEIFGPDGPVAVHARIKSGNSTLREHMPKAHQAQHDSDRMDGNSYRDWASKFSEDLLHIVNRVLLSGPVEEQGYKLCAGILRNADKAGRDVACKAAALARSQGACNYKGYLAAIESVKKSEASDLGNSGGCQDQAGQAGGASALPSSTDWEAQGMREPGYYK